ncbi:MAG: TlpA family protein disulfide reductase [Chloroflexi bacterium]|nr:TlpA family protein disulfide reductase [Chloroflexota bacterium]
MHRRLVILLAVLAGAVTMTGALAVVIAVAPPVVHPEPTVPAPGGPPNAAPSAPSASPASSPIPSTSTPAGSAPPASPSVGTASASAGASPSVDQLAGQFHLGQPAPSLMVARLGGGTIDLSKLRGTPVWLDFMGTYCPAARAEFALMEGFATRYAPTGLTVVAVDVAESEATIAAFAKSLGTTFPIGLDPDGTAQRAWGAVVLPLHYWIGADGIIRAAAYGGLTAAGMAANLQQILPTTSVTP